MGIQINEISQKYINQLENKKILSTVRFSEAVTSIKQAVEETSDAAKKEIESAIEPLKAKIAEKDEFIAQQTKENKSLQEKNNDLEQSVSSLKTKLSDSEKTISEQKKEYKTLKTENDILEESNAGLRSKLEQYKGIIKEAYKQGITPEIREQKNGIFGIISGLLHHKSDIKPLEEITKPVESEYKQIPQISVSKPIRKQNPVKRTKKTSVAVSRDLITKIENERINQRLDKNRMFDASFKLKALLSEAPQETTYSTVQEQFKKTMNSYVDAARSIINGRYNFEKEHFPRVRLGKDEKGRVILKERGTDFDNNFHPYNYEIFNQDGSSIEIYDGNADSYIEFRDTNGKNLLKVCYGDHYSAFIYDTNGRLMVAEGIKDGVIKYLNVNFNDVKPISAIENDEQVNVYAEGLIKKAKEGCSSNQHGYNDITDVDYYNSEGKRTVHEFYVNKKINPTPVFTDLYNPETEKHEKLIINGDFGIHGKIVDNGFGGMKIVQYHTKGITGINKLRENVDLKDFRIGFYKSTENEHFEVQSLYDENYEGDKDSFLQREVYEKRNYGLASHPLTRAFTFYDLTKHNIKPWDFSILKPYMK